MTKKKIGGWIPEAVSLMYPISSLYAGRAVFRVLLLPNDKGATKKVIFEGATNNCAADEAISLLTRHLRSTNMQRWEYFFVFATMTTGDGEFRPRFANDQELESWQEGPTIYEYANQLGASGWELLASHPVVFTQSHWQPLLEAQRISSELRAIEMVFKRSKSQKENFHNQIV